MAAFSSSVLSSAGASVDMKRVPNVRVADHADDDCAVSDFLATGDGAVKNAHANVGAPLLVARRRAPVEAMKRSISLSGLLSSC